MSIANADSAPRWRRGVSCLLWLAACSTSPHGTDGGALDAGAEARADAVAPVDHTGTDVPGGDGATAGDPLDPMYMPAIDMNPASYPPNVWVTGPLFKIQPDATPGSDHWAVVSAAQNEFESFQVHVRATTAAIALTVTVSDLVDARSGGRIPSDGTHVLVSREAYLNITQLSDANGMRGMVPDALIPTRDPYVHIARNAFPVTVPVSETRSAWVDVLVPPGTASGFYQGTVTVADGATTLATLPVVYRVWDFALPSTPTLRSTFGMSWNGLCVQAYGGYSGCGAYPNAGGDADTGTELTHVANATMFLDHRITLGDVVYAGPSGSDWTHFDGVYGPLMNGTAATLLTGARLTAIRYSGSVTSSSALQLWATHFRANAWMPRLFEYHCDEPPNGCTWSASLSEAQGVHAAASDFATLLTTDFSHASTNGALDAVDILSPVLDSVEARAGNTRASYDAWLMRPNKHLWWYQSCDEHESCSNGTAGGAASTWASYMVDASPVRNRVFQWLAYLDRIEGELYYATDYCWTGTCGGGNDPWTSQYAFGGNGDGTLFYPGTTARITGATPVPIPSIRLKHIRDGMEDFEYLHLLDVAGAATFAQTQARSFITNGYTFDNDPARLTAARLALGDELHRRALAH